MSIKLKNLTPEVLAMVNGTTPAKGATKAKKTKRVGGKHGGLVAACLGVCEAFKVFAWKNNTGSTVIGDRFVSFGKKGSPDILGVLPNGRFLAVECKVGRDKVSDDQRQFLDRLINSEAFVVVAKDTVDKFMGLLSEELRTISRHKPFYGEKTI